LRAKLGCAQGGVSSVAPKGFKAALARFAPQFQGYAQQDSQARRLPQTLWAVLSSFAETSLECSRKHESCPP
jgi:hypothetical protein